MLNKEICQFIQSVNDRFNEDRVEYVAERCVREGYGQTIGGYLDKNGKHMTQKEHFLYYYGSEKNKQKEPYYYFLRCPQLLLFVAEVMGVERVRIEKAYDILKSYEDKLKIRKKEKNGNYMYQYEQGKEIFRDFKSELLIADINRLVKLADTIWDAKSEIQKL